MIGLNIYFDLSGFFAKNSRIHAKVFGVTAVVWVKLFNMIRILMTSLFVGIDSGVEEALARSQRLLQNDLLRMVS